MVLCYFVLANYLEIICNLPRTHRRSSKIFFLSNCDGQGKDIHKTFLNNVNEFQQLGVLPVKPPWIQHRISLDDIFDNRAVWHKSCHLKFASSKIERVKSKGKRNANDQSSEGRRAPKTGSINKHTYNKKNTILAFNEGMKSLKEALANRNFELQSLTLVKAKRSIRNDVFEEPECRFNGVFEPG